MLEEGPGIGVIEEEYKGAGWREQRTARGAEHVMRGEVIAQGQRDRH